MGRIFLNSANLWPLALLLSMGMLLAVFWFYPSQLKQQRRIWQFVLPSLRMLAIAAIVLSVLKPTILRQKTSAGDSAVVLLVDRSGSMAVADVQLPPAQQVALADAVGALPAGKRQVLYRGTADLLPGLRSGLEEMRRVGADLEYARLASSKSLGEAQKRLEEISTQVRSGLQRLSETATSEKLNRDDVAQIEKTIASAGSAAGWHGAVARMLDSLERSITAGQQKADEELVKREADVRSACAATVKRSRFELIEQALTRDGGLLSQLGRSTPVFGFSVAESTTALGLRSGDQNVRRLLVDPSGNRSRISQGVITAAEQLRGTSARAMVLFSDGRAVADSTTALLSRSNLPVIAVQCGSEAGVRDIALECSDAPSSAFVGETIHIKARVKGWNCAGIEQQLQLTFGGETQERKVKLEGDTAEVEFQVKAKAAGIQELRLKTSGIEQEATLLNNTVQRPVKVIEGKIRVLLLASRATWDFQYVQNAVERSPWATVTTRVLKKQDGRFDLGPEKIAEAEVICLFGVGAKAFAPGQIEAIHRGVSQRGASLVIVPRETAALESLNVDPLLAELLPYRPGGKPVWRDWPGEGPVFQVTPTEQGRRLDALRLADTPEENLARWNGLQPIFHYLVLPPLKPNATGSLLMEKQSQAPLLVESRLGAGRILFLGMDETWRWRMRIGERDQDRLWTQLLRYAAEEPYALTKGALAGDISSAYLQPGQPLRVRARILAGDVTRAPEVQVRQGERVLHRESLSPVGEALPGRYASQLRDLPEGTYQVHLVGAAGAAVSFPLQIGDGMQAEMANVSADPANLRKIAAATGGVCIGLEQVGDLPKYLSQIKFQNSANQEIALWNSGYLFVLVLACLSAEWGIRKRLGLA